MPDDKNSISVLIIDNDANVRTVLRQALELEHFEVSEAHSRTSTFEIIAQHNVDLITLELQLLDVDGLQVIDEIRTTRNIPIIIVTGRGEPLDRVAGLDRGADDYVVKPFDPREVILRIRQVLKRYGIDGAPRGRGPSKARTRFAFNDRIFDARKRELRDHAGKLINLTALECQLLDLFVQHPRRVFSRDEIMRLVTGRDWSPLDRTVDGHVARLRRKIEPPSDELTVIKAIRDVGYVFVADVSER